MGNSRSIIYHFINCSSASILPSRIPLDVYTLHLSFKIRPDEDPNGELIQFGYLNIEIIANINPPYIEYEINHTTTGSETWTADVTIPDYEHNVFINITYTDEA